MSVKTSGKQDENVRYTFHSVHEVLQFSDNQYGRLHLCGLRVGSLLQPFEGVKGKHTSHDILETKALNSIAKTILAQVWLAATCAKIVQGLVNLIQVYLKYQREYTPYDILQ